MVHRRIDRKGDINWKIVGLIIALVFLGIVGFMFFPTVRSTIRDMIGLKESTASDESQWALRCEGACSTAKFNVKDCNEVESWRTAYCIKSYNDTMQCGQAEKLGLVSCPYETEGVACVCA